MTIVMTKSQIDRLGERIRSGIVDSSTRRALDELYAAYAEVSEDTFKQLCQVLDSLGPLGESGLEPSAARRPTKTLDSIAAKLAREHARLSQMQDIIGCRVVVENRREQGILSGSLMITPQAREAHAALSRDLGVSEKIVAAILKRPFADASLDDRNARPSNGYRAVHIIVKDFGAPYEIQIRTELQNRWAQLSERLNDIYPGAKYGKGAAGVQSVLYDLSDRTDATERDYEATVASFEGDDVDYRFIVRHRARLDDAIEALERRYEEIEERYRL